MGNPDHNELEIDKFFKALIKLKGTELHLTVAKPPQLRVGGALKSLNRGPIREEEMTRLCLPMMDERNRQVFELTGGADFAYTLPFEGNVWRFRVHVFHQSEQLGMVAHKMN